MLDPTRRGRRGRLLRELLPVGAAAGAAAIAVTFIVGGTTAELVSPAQQGPWPVATSPAPTGAPSVITNASAPRRDERARSASGADVELAAGPVAIVTGALTAPRSGAAGGRVGADGARPSRLAPVTPAPSTTELAGPVLAPVAEPVVSVTPVEPSVVTAATTTGRPGRSGTAPGRAPKTSPTTRPTTDAADSADTLTAAGTSSTAPVDPANGDTAGRGRGHGPESAPGQARATERSAGDARSQPR